MTRAQWLEDRRAELLPVEYFHLVFTLPQPIEAIAYQNKALLYDMLFKATAQSLRTIAADPKHPGRYTHRVAIANSRLVDFSDGSVAFRWKDYRHESKPKVMRLPAAEFTRRFLLHVLPSGT